jgi:hypothetical protein
VDAVCDAPCVLGVSRSNIDSPGFWVEDGLKRNGSDNRCDLALARVRSLLSC